MHYSAEEYELLFQEPCGPLSERPFEALRHQNVFRYRARTIKAGEQMEVEIYPIWNCRAEVQAARKAATREAQRNLNDKNAKRTINRLINANFSTGDLAVHMTYEGTPPDEKQARLDIRNYLRRVRDYRRKNGMSELKYLYVIEYDSGEGGKKKKRIHQHVVMSGMDRDEAERLWGKGRCNADRLQPDEFGLEALARYITKDPKGAKRWCGSRNLKKPKISPPSDTRVSKRKVEKMAEDFEEAPAAILERIFQGYVLNDCEVKRSAFVAGAYVYARMRREPRRGGAGG